MQFSWSVVVAGSVVASVVSVAAFSQAPLPTEFEVSSIRLNASDDHIVTINVGPGSNFTARGYTLVLLMQRAYGVMDWNVAGGPGWIRTDRYDVVAKAPVGGNLTEQQLQPMLQRMLADRFQLRLHREAQRRDGYAMVAAKGGPKLKRAANDEEHSDTFRMTGSELHGQGIRMTDFARYVGGKLGWVMVDQTGISGSFDVEAHWTHDTEQREAIPGGDPRDALRDAVSSALEKQLGLRIVPHKIVVQMLVIDGVERASEN